MDCNVFCKADSNLIDEKHAYYKRFNVTHSELFESEIAQQALIMLIDNIDKTRKLQAEVYKLYFCNKRGLRNSHRPRAALP